LTGLERIAEEVRTRPIRRMAEDLCVEHRLPPAATEQVVAEAIEAADRYAEQRDQLR
jgi:hypothetical protein